MSETLMRTLELNSRDFGTINERLWNRLHGSNHASIHRQRQASSFPPGDPRHQRLPPGTPPAIGAAATAPNSTSPYATQQPPPPPPLLPRQPPPPLLSLFAEDSGSDDEPAGGDRDRPSRSNGGNGWGGAANPPPSSRGQQQRSLRPWEWPDICRGASGSKPSSLKELEYFTPSGGRTSNMLGDSDDERIGPPSPEGRWGMEPDETGRQAAGADVGLERRSIYGGLGHVKKRLWGSMFEAAGASIKRRVVAADGAQEEDRPDTVNGGNVDCADDTGTLMHRSRRQQQQQQRATSDIATAAAAVRGGAGPSGVDHRFPPLPRVASRTPSGAALDFVDGAGDCQDESRNSEKKDAGGEHKGRSTSTGAKVDNTSGTDGTGSTIDGGNGNTADPELDEGGGAARGGYSAGGQDGRKASRETARDNTRGRERGDRGGTHAPRNGGASGSGGHGVGVSPPTAPGSAGTVGSSGSRDRFPPLPGTKKKARQKAKEKRSSDVPSRNPVRGNRAPEKLQSERSSSGRGVPTGSGR